MKKITLLGSTGSIGTQTLEVIDFLENYKIHALSCGKNIALLIKQIEKYKPERVCTSDYEDAKIIKEKFPKLDVLHSGEGLV